jgi:hypothetical protein
LKELVNVGAGTDDLVDLVELVEREVVPLDGVVLKRREKEHCKVSCIK